MLSSEINLFPPLLILVVVFYLSTRDPKSDSLSALFLSALGCGCDVTSYFKILPCGFPAMDYNRNWELKYKILLARIFYHSNKTETRKPVALETSGALVYKLHILNEVGCGQA